MIPVIFTPSLPFARLEGAAVRTGATGWYVGPALSALWDAGRLTGVDPVVLAAQCALETNWGKFGGAVTISHGNTCGLKTRTATGDLPGDHAQFALDPESRPWLGALAHAHHLRLYCGFPVPFDSPDPRSQFVRAGTRAYGSVTYVEDLGGKWAPASDYGARIARIVTQVFQGPLE
jgi:N-acetylmuramoyl-L-alanine amidase